MQMHAANRDKLRAVHQRTKDLCTDQATGNLWRTNLGNMLTVALREMRGDCGVSLPAACDKALLACNALAVLSDVVCHQLPQEVAEHNGGTDTDELEETLAVTLLAALQALITEREGAQNAFTTVQPGAPTCRGKAEDGIKYLVAQAVKPDSAYYMPDPSDTQQVWEDWFVKLAELPVHYIMSSEQIIHAASGHLKPSARAVYGWHERVHELRAQGKAVTLEAFFTHIRKQLFVSRDTRQQAYEEMCNIPNTLHDIVDCAALVTRLQQLWQRRYPDNSSEREPSPRYEVCLDVHRMMLNFKDSSYKQRNGNVLLLAWHEYSFPAAALFSEHLLASLHTTVADSKTASDAYMSTLYTHLQNAQEMYVRVHKPTVAAASNARNVAFPLTNNNKFQSGSNSAPKRAGNKNKRQRAEAPPANQGKQRKQQRKNGNAAPSAGTQRPADLKQQREQQAPVGVRLLDVAAAAGINRSHSECMQLYERRACVLCGNVGSHKGLMSCPALPMTKKAAVEEVQKKRKAYLDKAWESGVAAAVAAHK